MTPQRWSRIDDLFHAALDRDAADVDEFLQQECGEDAALYAEVRRMLDQHKCAGLLDQSPWPSGFGSRREMPTESQSQTQPVFTAEDVVSGRYRIVRFISRGGMGEVYEAEDLELKGHVALKTLLPSIAGDTRMIARFKQEIQLSRRVAHPNVCRVFDFARHPADGSGTATYFLSMEFLAGETLSAKLQRESRLSPDVALPILQQMANALDAAHRAGVVHRDFKPSNVMLVPDAGGLRAVVTDFGLARSVHPSETTVTRSAQLMGTFEYMAPELFSGHSASIASDIYAFGMVASKMLTGALPSSAGTIEPAAPSPSLGNFAPDLAPSAQHAILRAIDPRPGSRFSSAGQFLQALRGETAPSIVVTISPPARRLVLSGVTVLILAASAIAWFIWNNARNQPAPEALAFFRKGVEEIQSGTYFAATKALENAVVLSPHFSLAHARLAEAWLELLIPERAKDEMLAARRGVTGMSTIDRLQIEAIDFAVARDFAAALEKHEQVHRANPGVFEVDLGRAYEKAQRLNDAIETYRRGAEGPAHSPAAWLRLAVIYGRMGKPDQAAQAFRRAEEIYRAANNFEGVIEVLFQRGLDANRRGAYEEAVTDLQKARETARMAGHLQQEIAATLQLATSAYAVNDADLAERYARQALEEAQANQMEIMAISGMLNLGQARFQKRDFPAAEKHYQNALALAQRAGAFGMVALCQMTLATLYDQINRPEDMIRHVTAALKYYEPNGHLNESAACLIMIGRYQRNHDKLADALESSVRAADLAERARSRAQMAQANSAIGSILAAQERYPEALERYRRNLDSATDPNSQRYAGLQCGNILRILGRFDQARELFDRTDTLAEKIPSLRLRIRRSRAALALSGGKYADAVSIARQLLASGGELEPGESFELKRILCLALLGNGNKPGGRRSCEEALTAAPALGDVAMLVSARLAALQARIETSDKPGANAIFADLKPSLDSRPESRWRALALMSGADQTYSTEARRALAVLSQTWDKAAYDDYLKRNDIARLSRPLLVQEPANSR